MRVVLSPAARASLLEIGDEQQGIRRRVFGSYLIFYRIEEQRVTILDILNAVRDIEASGFDAP